VCPDDTPDPSNTAEAMPNIPHSTEKNSHFISETSLITHAKSMQ